MRQGKPHSLHRISATSPIIQHAERRFPIAFQALVVSGDFQQRFSKRLDVPSREESAIDAVTAEFACRAHNLTSDDC
jgi:hypothetical protein